MKGLDHMHGLTHVIMGMVIAIFIWKLIRITFKSVLFFLVLGGIALLLFPKAVVLIGGLGFLFVGFLITLIVLGVGGLFFLGNDN
jgi:hypothetical protein